MFLAFSWMKINSFLSFAVMPEILSRASTFFVTMDSRLRTAGMTDQAELSLCNIQVKFKINPRNFKSMERDGNHSACQCLLRQLKTTL